jgi:hypothetical protein
VVQPQLVQASVLVPIEELGSGSARTAHLGAAAIDERTEVIDQMDGSTGIHAMTMPGTVTSRHPYPDL